MTKASIAQKGKKKLGKLLIRQMYDMLQEGKRKIQILEFTEVAQIPRGMIDGG
jgi:hypothetical protein